MFNTKSEIIIWHVKILLFMLIFVKNVKSAKSKLKKRMKIFFDKEEFIENEKRRFIAVPETRSFSEPISKSANNSKDYDSSFLVKESSKNNKSSYEYIKPDNNGTRNASAPSVKSYFESDIKKISIESRNQGDKLNRKNNDTMEGTENTKLNSKEEYYLNLHGEIQRRLILIRKNLKRINQDLKNIDSITKKPYSSNKIVVLANI